MIVPLAVLSALAHCYLALPTIDNEVTKAAATSCPDIYRSFSKKHTYCLARNETCQMKDNTVSQEHIDEILKAHNDYRSRVATGSEKIGNLPQAADMLEMEWDDTLAAVAQKHAETCYMGHDCKECRETPDFSYVGQNLYESSISTTSFIPKADWTAAVKSWYDEVKDFTSKIIPSFQETGYVIGHFTQVIWAQSWKVGCGYTTYVEGGSMKQRYTCNYGPGGNVKSTPIYTSGNRCSQCPKNTECSSSYKGLCKVNDDSVPDYSKKEPNELAFCNFREDCGFRSEQGMPRWTIRNSLEGSFLRVELNGGETSKIYYEDTIPTAPSKCIRMRYRKGPYYDGEEYSHKAHLLWTLAGSPTYRETELRSNDRNFIGFGMTLGINPPLKVGFSFSVPSGKPKQFFELSEFRVIDGKC